MAKKRANGEGNIRKRADGRWEGRYTAGYHPETGKRIIKNVLGKTQAECKAKLTKGTKLPESRTVIRKLSFAPRSRAALSLTIAAQFLHCRGRSLWLQRCDF